MSSDLVETKVRIKKDQHQWLKDHPSINFAGFTRDALDKLIETRSIDPQVKNGDSSDK